jgi:hypothetical protein
VAARVSGRQGLRRAASRLKSAAYSPPPDAPLAPPRVAFWAGRIIASWVKGAVLSGDKTKLSPATRSRRFFSAIDTTDDLHVITLAIRGIRVPEYGLSHPPDTFEVVTSMTFAQLTAAAEAAERAMREPGCGDLAPYQAAQGLREYRDAKFRRCP